MDCLIYAHKEELESCDNKTEVFACHCEIPRGISVVLTKVKFRLAQISCKHCEEVTKHTRAKHPDKSG